VGPYLLSGLLYCGTLRGQAPPPVARRKNAGIYVCLDRGARWCPGASLGGFSTDLSPAALLARLHLGHYEEPRLDLGHYEEPRLDLGHYEEQGKGEENADGKGIQGSASRDLCA
jgi:hypothetical protein